MGEFTGGKTPNDEFFSGEIVLATGEIPAGSRGTGSHHSHHIHRKSQRQTQLIWQPRTIRVHLAAGVENKVVAIPKQNDRTVSGIGNSSGARDIRFYHAASGDRFHRAVRRGKITANLDFSGLRSDRQARLGSNPRRWGNQLSDFFSGDADSLG